MIEADAAGDGGVALKRFIEAFLRQNMEAIPPQSETSGKVQLEVWRTPQKRRFLGVEMGHADVVNIWLKALNVPRGLPDTITVAKKRWAGHGWTDDARKGANSNLIAYEDFHTHPVSRLGVTRIDDARLLLEALLP